MNKYNIYLITDITNGKKYIGQTFKEIQDRFNDHWNEAQRQIKKGDTTCYLHNAMVSHGIENFKLELIEANIPENKIDLKESYYIDLYKTYYLNGTGYNMTTGGQGIHGYKHSKDGKKKISEGSIRA